MSHSADILEAIVAEVDAGRGAALCAIVATRGSTPQPPGTIVAVDAGARMTGTLGGGCVEADIRGRARDALAAGSSPLLTFKLDHDFALDEGMICGGSMDVAVQAYATPDQTRVLREAAERLRSGRAASLAVRVRAPSGRVEYRVRFESAPTLVIAGGGHIGRMLARRAVPLGFHVTVIDDRVEFANAERFPPPMRAVAGDIAATLGGWPIDAATYVVIVTRGHRHDERALAAVVGTPARYVGMIGSRRKIAVIFDELVRDGIPRARLEAVHAPIGVDIGAVTPEEIAVSIAAELIQVRRARRARVVEGPFPVDDKAP